MFQRGRILGGNFLLLAGLVNVIPAAGTRLLVSNTLGRPTGGDNCVTRILRGKARASNDQDVVDPELGPAACCHVHGGNIPYCGGIVEKIHGGGLPGGEVRAFILSLGQRSRRHSISSDNLEAGQNPNLHLVPFRDKPQINSFWLSRLPNLAAAACAVNS